MASIFGTEVGSVVGKVLAETNIKKIQDLVKKTDLKIEEIHELLYLLTAEESKLLNLSEHERYILGKFFAWIREFVKLTEDMYELKKYVSENGTNEALITLEKAIDIQKHNMQFLIDVFLWLARTSMSKEAKAFDKILEQKFEHEYHQYVHTPIQQQQQQEKKSLWWFKW